MRLLKKIALGLLAVFVVIQFIRPARNISGQVLPIDITHVVPVSPAIQATLKDACYDCHSNNTNYPWYMNVQPVAWFMASHVVDGKAAFNFSDFGSYSKRKQANKLKSLAKQLEQEEMPLASYRLMHKAANLSKAQKEELISWAKQSADSLSGHD